MGSSGGTALTKPLLERLLFDDEVELLDELEDLEDLLEDVERFLFSKDRERSDDFL